MKKKFRENTTLKELLSSKKARKILEKIDFPCLGCPFAPFEMERLTLKEIAKMYQFDLEKILKELNKK